MAEGMLGGILGEEDEKPEVEAADTLTGADAFAAAVAAKLAGNDPGVARKTEEFLCDQSALLKVQKKHLEEEHEARLHFLSGQAREVDIRRFGLRLRVGIQLFLVLISTVIGIGAAVMIHDAVTSRGVVIEPFDIAPSIAAQMPSGKMVATGLLDVLTRIQAANHISAEHRRLSNSWTNEIAIEVPEAGISIGQVERILKERFGHDQHIDGDLMQTEKAGLALTVRGKGILPKKFTGQASDLDKLLTQAGEYVYSQSQPGLWAAYLNESDRIAETIDFCAAVYGKANPSDRPYILNAWGNALSTQSGGMREALALWKEAVRLKPDYWSGYNNIMVALSAIGEEEDIVQVGQHIMKAAGGRPGRAPEFTYANYDDMVWDLPAARAGIIDDLESHGGVGTAGVTGSGAENVGVAITETWMHDTQAAILRLKTPIDAKDTPAVSAAAIARALLAEESGDLDEAAREWDTFAVEYANPIVLATSTSSICYAAVTYERTGQPAKADAALKPFGNGTFVDCYRFKGDVLDLRGDWSGAREWYAKAVKLAPSIPSGYYSWGLALAKHGDLDGASAKFKDANQKGPHWADPLKAWGDVLMKQGKTEDALAKYDEALKYAPEWKQLKEAREALTKQSH